MAEPVIISFATQGLQPLHQAFQNLEQRIDRLGQTVDKNAQRESAAYQRAAREIERWQQQETRASEREAKQRERVAEAEAKRRAGIVERSANMAGRLAAQQARDEIRAQEEITRAHEREARQRERIHQREAEEQRRTARERVHTMGEHVSHGAERVFGKPLEIMGAIAGIGAGFEIADIARERLNSQRGAAQLSVMGRGKPGSSVDEILSRAGEVGVATGTKKDDLIKAVQSYVSQTQDFSGGMGNMEFFAKVAKVRGKSVGEVADVATQMMKENPNISGEDLKNSVLAAMGPGAFGSAPGAAVGQMIAKFGKSRGAFAGDQGDVMKSLMGIGQIAFQQAGTARGASGAVQGFIEKVQENKKGAMSAMGVHFGKGGTIESPEQAIAAILQATGGNLQAISKHVGPQAMALFEPLAQSFRQAGGGAKGLAAVQAQLGAASSQQYTQEDVEKDFGQVMSTAAEKFDKAVATLKEAAEEKLAPWIDKLANKLPELVPQIEKLMEAAASVADFMLNHLGISIAGALTASIGADIAKAQIGELVKSLLARALGGSAASSVASGASGAAGVAGTGAGVLGVAGAGLAGGLATAAATLGPIIGLSYLAESKRSERGVQAADLFSQQHGDNLEALKGEEARIGGVNKRAASVTAEMQGLRDKGQLDDATARRMMSDPAVAGQSVAYQQELQRLIAAIEKNTGAHERGAVAMNATDPNHPSRSNPIDQRSTPN